jgi:hypothetical protein
MCMKKYLPFYIYYTLYFIKYFTKYRIYSKYNIFITFVKNKQK